MPTISDRLVESRKALGLSQQALADCVGISARSQRNYESGERSPDADYLAAIAAAGADVLYILTGQHDPAAPALDAAEQVLVDSYRRCTPQARQNLIQTAALLSAGLGVSPPSTPASVQVGNMHNTAPGGVQVGYAAGEVKIKKGR